MPSASQLYEKLHFKNYALDEMTLKVIRNVLNMHHLLLEVLHASPRIRGVTIMRYINLHFTYLLTY